jgi:hypothetical protein
MYMFKVLRKTFSVLSDSELFHDVKEKGYRDTEGPQTQDLFLKYLAEL